MTLAARTESTEPSDKLSAGCAAAISTTAKALGDALILHGDIDRLAFNTRPSLATKTTSIGNFMKKVWTELHGAMIIAVPSGSEVCFSRPVRRLAESNAVSSVVAMIAPVVVLTS